MFTLGTAYYYLGRFEQANEIFKKLYFDENIYKYKLCGRTPKEFAPLGEVLFEMLENSGGNELLNKLPQYMNYNYKQSIERGSDESYEEYREFHELLMRCMNVNGVFNELAEGLFRDELAKMRESKDIEIVAKSYFFEAELWFGVKKYFNAYDFYLEAAITEGSKALYYGYAGNMLYKVAVEDMSNIDYSLLIGASILTYRAIDLDYNNAKWHFNEGLILLIMGKEFLTTAKNEFMIADEVLRPDQFRLKKEVDIQLNFVNEIIK